MNVYRFLATAIPLVFALLPVESRPAKSPPPPPAATAPRVASAEPRTALIIGNSSYESAPLRNPVNDAQDMAAALRKVGFDVTQKENLNKKEMRKEIRSFGQKLRGGGVGLFYFAGHGIQVQARNYLIPVEASIEREGQVEDEAVEVGVVLEEMDAAGNSLNIVILDACRNNSLPRSYRSDSRGLALMSAPRGCIIAFATAPGRVASDGPGRNGIYTQELLKTLHLPGLRIEDIFKRVRVAVRETTQGAQIPWETSSLEGDFYFSPVAAAPPKPPESAPAGPAAGPGAAKPAPTSITHGPVTLAASNSYLVGNERAEFKFFALTVRFNTFNDLTQAIGNLPVQPGSVGSHVLDENWYYWRVPEGEYLLLAFRNLSANTQGWCLVQKGEKKWFFKTNADKWQVLEEGKVERLAWTSSNAKIVISVSIPKQGGGWSANDVKYTFGG